MLKRSGQVVYSMAVGMAALALSGASAQTVATVAGGKVEGIVVDGAAVWRAIPYAAPPVGALRWRPPKPAVHWDGIRSAKQFGASCPQMKEAATQLSPLGALSEDCLFLNIWAPAAKGARRPVMLWIHGGGFIAGTGSEAQFDGSALTRRGVIVVTMNYRLGRLGFFAHPALSAEHPDEPHGNYGLMDQVAALKWVRDNIAAFGGDPNNMTLIGESAGAMSTFALSTSPLARGLFHKMIVESAPTNWPMRDIRADRSGKPAAETIGSQWAASQGITGNDASALAALRALPADRIAPPAPDVSTIMALMAGTGPMIDGKVLTDMPDAVYVRGGQDSMPMILGTNSQEGVVWSFEEKRLGLTTIIPQTGEEVLARLPEGLKRDDVQAAYLKEAGGNAAKADGLLRADAFMGAGAYRVAAMAARMSPTWLYRFDTTPAQTRAAIAGAPHGTEIFYVFGTLDRFRYKAGGTSAQDRAISDQIVRYWTSFAATGKPAAKGAPDWRAFDPARPSALKVENSGVTYGPLENARILAGMAH